MAYSSSVDRLPPSKWSQFQTPTESYWTTSQLQVTLSSMFIWEARRSKSSKSTSTTSATQLSHPIILSAFSPALNMTQIGAMPRRSTARLTPTINWTYRLRAFYSINIRNSSALLKKTWTSIWIQLIRNLAKIICGFICLSVLLFQLKPKNSVEHGH